MTEDPLLVYAAPAFANRAWQPYNAALYEAVMNADPQIRVRDYRPLRLLARPCDVLHLHWPESSLQAPSRFRARRWTANLLRRIHFARRRGAKVVWTVHNLGPHDPRHPDLLEWFWREYVPRVDAVIHLSQAGRTAAEGRFPRLATLPAYVLPHGETHGWYPDRVSPLEARTRLGLDPHAPVIGYFGQIRAYKNIPALLGAFRGVRESKARLLVAGLAPPDGQQELRRLAAADPRVRLDLRLVPDDEIQLYLRGSDLMVFPYREILNSGAAMLALGYDRPTLLPRIGALAELAARVGSDWMRTYEGDLTAATLEEALAWARMGRRGARAPDDYFSWSRIGQETARAYREIVTRSRPA